MNPSELDELYRGVGRCIWHLQYLEDVLHTLLVLKIDIREPGRVSEKEANAALAKYRRASLGTALGIAEKHGALPAGLLAKLRILKEERDWLVHRSMHQQGDTLYTDEGRTSVFSRLAKFMEESVSLKGLALEEVASFTATHGVSSVRVEAIAQQKIARPFLAKVPGKVFAMACRI